MWSTWSILSTYYKLINTKLGGIIINNSIKKKNLTNDGDSNGTEIDKEKYYRPSNRSVLNTGDYRTLFSNYFQSKETKAIPNEYVVDPENTILNYFGILRQAANPQEGKYIGCGTIGYATIPYPFAYSFISSEYKKRLSYEQYLDMFQNILHINLIKYKEVPVYANNDQIVRYFVEIEAIEGSDKNIGVFAYYYGFVDLIEENGSYKISDLQFYGENYLCAPYHRWSYDAEAVVQIEYGGWCSLVKELLPTVQKDYVKYISFEGTDGYHYCMVFFQLTNDNDILIAQFRREANDSWTLIQINPEDCIKE